MVEPKIRLRAPSIWVSASEKPAARPPAVPINQKHMVVGAQVLGLFVKAIRHDADEIPLGKSRLVCLLGHGTTLATVEGMVLDGLRAVRAAWRNPLDSTASAATQQFVRAISQGRQELDDMNFATMIAAVRRTDRSPDRINLDRL